MCELREFTKGIVWPGVFVLRKSLFLLTFGLDLGLLPPARTRYFFSHLGYPGQKEAHSGACGQLMGSLLGSRYFFSPRRYYRSHKGYFFSRIRYFDSLQTGVFTGETAP
jgi:hypothetical protein